MSQEYQYWSVGEALRKARESLGYDINEIAGYLKIRTAYLKALESGDFASIPGNVYVIGFLRTYAEFLGLEAEELIGHYKLEIKAPRKVSDFPVPEAVKDEQKPGRHIVLGSVIALLFAFVLWRGVRDQPVVEVANQVEPEEVAKKLSGLTPEAGTRNISIPPNSCLEGAERKLQCVGLCLTDSANAKDYALKYCQISFAEYYHGFLQ